MDIVRELQKVKNELEQKQGSFSTQIRSELSRFSGETRTVLNTIDDKISQKVQEEVAMAFADLKTLLNNLKIRQGAA